jgi:hypothetical protein
MHTRLATTTIVAADARRPPVKNRLPDCGATVSFATPDDRPVSRACRADLFDSEPDL